MESTAHLLDNSTVISPFDYYFNNNDPIGGTTSVSNNVTHFLPSTYSHQQQYDPNSQQPRYQEAAPITTETASYSSTTHHNHHNDTIVTPFPSITLPPSDHPSFTTTAITSSSNLMGREQDNLVTTTTPDVVFHQQQYHPHPSADTILSYAASATATGALTYQYDQTEGNGEEKDVGGVPILQRNGRRGGGRGGKRVNMNVKERKRNLAINSAFRTLQSSIPETPPDSTLPKIKTLRLAIEYIRQLQTVLTVPSSPSCSHSSSPTTWPDEQSFVDGSDHKSTTSSEPLLSNFSQIVAAEIQTRNSYKERAEEMLRDMDMEESSTTQQWTNWRH